VIEIVYKKLLLLMIFMLSSMGVAQCAEPVTYQREVAGIQVTIVEMPFGTRAKVGLAHRGVGFSEPLASIAAREGATVAINGTFFDAYGGRPEPNNNLISNGKFVHIGDVGTTIGFFNNGGIKISSLKINIEGATNESYLWPNNWYAWGINHTPDTTGAYIYTPERGATVGFAKGISVVVSGNRVIKKVVDEDVVIPEDGYVINFIGDESYQGKLFSVGTRVAYRMTVQGTGNWSGVLEGLGAGPRLVSSGNVSINATAEGFTEDKITKWSSSRSAIGIKSNGTIVLVTSPSATIQQLAVVMIELGATDAMNLDGGASSGLWINGNYSVEPGRDVSNALLFFLG